MKFRNMITLVMACSVVILAGCRGEDGLTPRERTCMQAGGTFDDCTYEGQRHEERLAMASNGINPDTIRNPAYDNMDYNTVDYPPVVPNQSYTNYYGNPQYGYWSGGYYHFYNPYGIYAMQTNSYLLSAGLHGLAAYIGTKAALQSTWNTQNPHGYISSSRSSKTYIGKGGVILSKDEALRRQTQSRNALKRNNTKLKQQLAQQKLKNKQLQSSKSYNKSYNKNNGISTNKKLNLNTFKSSGNKGYSSSFKSSSYKKSYSSYKPRKSSSYSKSYKRH